MDKKEKLLQTALKLFVEFGFHDTPTSKIAKEAGIANGTLFYFFPTKDELVIALYLDIKSRMMEFVSVEIANEKTIHGIMKAYYSASLQWAMKNKPEFRFVEQFTNSPYLNQIEKKEVQKHIIPVLDLLRQGVKDKILKPLDVEIIFTLISGHTFGINQYLVSKRLSKPKQDKVINDTFEMLWDMIT